MSSQTGRAQLVRLLRLVLLLQGKTYPSAVQLAETFKVTRRTIYRDFETLTAAGLTVHFDPDRKGFFMTPTLNLDIPPPKKPGRPSK